MLLRSNTLVKPPGDGVNSPLGWRLKICKKRSLNATDALVSGRGRDERAQKIIAMARTSAREDASWERLEDTLYSKVVRNVPMGGARHHYKVQW